MKKMIAKITELWVIRVNPCTAVTAEPHAHCVFEKDDLPEEATFFNWWYDGLPDVTEWMCSTECKEFPHSMNTPLSHTVEKNSNELKMYASCANSLRPNIPHLDEPPPPGRQRLRRQITRWQLDNSIIALRCVQQISNDSDREVLQETGISQCTRTRGVISNHR